MKYIKQFLIILIMAVLGGLLNWLIPLPIPATVWGMALMFIALMSGLVKLDQVEDTADFFLGIMPMLFVPLAVGLMDTWQVLAEYALPIILIVVISFFICYAVTGKTADFIIGRGEKKTAAFTGRSAGKEADHE